MWRVDVRCPRCNGNLYRQPWDTQLVWWCLQCSRTWIGEEVKSLNMVISELPYVEEKEHHRNLVEKEGARKKRLTKGNRKSQLTTVIGAGDLELRCATNEELSRATEAICWYLQFGLDPKPIIDKIVARMTTISVGEVVNLLLHWGKQNKEGK